MRPFPGVAAATVTHLQVLQLFDQRPAADEALVEQGEDGRTFQDGLPESSPRTYKSVGRRKRWKAIKNMPLYMYYWWN